MTEKMEKKFRKVVWPQLVAGLGASLLLLQVGFMGGWSSPYVIYLTSPQASFSATMFQISWVVSIINVGRPLGAIGGALCVNYFGSKTTVLLNSVPIGICWLLIALANDVIWLYIARFFGGIGIGMCYSCFSLFLGEIADSSNRGALVALGTTGMPFGTLSMTLMGAYLSMHVSAAIAFGFCLIMVLIFVWLPESPYHLIKNDMYEKAKASIHWYHRTSDVEVEFIELQKFVESQNVRSLRNILQELKSAHFRKMMFIIGTLIMYHQMSGINSIVLYMESILHMAKVSVMPPAMVVPIVISFGIVGSLLSMYLIDKCGRKFLMIVSCIGVMFACGLLTTEFQLLHYNFDPKSIEAIPIVGLCIFYMTIYIGILPVPSAILGEIFPPHLKCVAACFTSSLAGVFSFISTSTFLPMMEVLTNRYWFISNGLIISTAIIFTVIYVPETKGMTLQDIQSQLKKNSKRNRTAPASIGESQKGAEENPDISVISR